MYFNNLGERRFLRLFSILILQIFHVKSNIVVRIVFQNFEMSTKAPISR